MKEYVSERIVNISELEKLINDCYVLAQLIQQEKPNDARLLLLVGKLKKASEFEFKIEQRCICKIDESSLGEKLNESFMVVKAHVQQCIDNLPKGQPESTEESLLNLTELLDKVRDNLHQK